MLSRLDPLIRALSPRSVETPDAKMALRRDESQINERNKRNDHEAAAQATPWEDTTEVSLEALRNFLRELLYAGGPPADVPASETVAPPSPAQITPETDTGRAASRAAKAYQTTGRIVHDKNIEETHAPLPPPSTNNVALGNDFGPEERAQIEGFISDLQELERQGRTVLILQRNLTFLESIRLAIDVAKIAPF